jgi:hypothetical protein
MVLDSVLGSVSDVLRFEDDGFLASLIIRTPLNLQRAAVFFSRSHVTYAIRNQVPTIRKVTGKECGNSK